MTTNNSGSGGSEFGTTSCRYADEGKERDLYLSHRRTVAYRLVGYEA